MPLGLNIDGLFIDHDQRRALYDYTALVRPGLHVVVGDAGTASEMAGLFPATRIVYRHYPDRSVAEIGDVRAYIDTAASNTIDDRVILSLGNELNPPDKRMADMLCEGIHYATSIGRRLSVYGAAVGNPPEDAWAGVLFPLLEALVGTDHALSVHEYFERAPLAEPWHVGRIMNAINAAPGSLLIDVAEFGMDSANDPMLQGWRKTMWPETYATLLAAGESYYASLRAKGIKINAAIYCYGHDRTNNLWGPFDVASTAILELLRASVPMPIPTPTPEPVPEPTPDPEPAPEPEPPDLAALIARIEALERRLAAMAEALTA